MKPSNLHSVLLLFLFVQNLPAIAEIIAPEAKNFFVETPVIFQKIENDRDLAVFQKWVRKDIVLSRISNSPEKLSGTMLLFLLQGFAFTFPQ